MVTSSISCGPKKDCKNKRLFDQIHGITKMGSIHLATLVPTATTPQNKDSISTKSVDQTVANTEYPNEPSTASAKGKSIRGKKLLNVWAKEKQGIMDIATGILEIKRVSTDTDTKGPSSLPIPIPIPIPIEQGSSNNNTSPPAKILQIPNNQQPDPSNVIEERQSEKGNKTNFITIESPH
ncbi:hypothetical protein RFI_38725 [Reticulomyxa filosa]|uniref:Uncharacterized protein n=1 Tax=Reticulomyxa filosa TaxID=46433 RepID=X6LDE3_RETFI|nr:hypothetical protein RFI_38725 [Reticulomyxa filosa]|eukprot:ETN98764.1 hypothetical protein RFI_38725 [Reticulomyxa filosa]